MTSRNLLICQNYVELEDDDDVDMDDEDDDDDDDEFDDDAYSDDDDDSWKIRRSAAKLLHSLIGTRIDLIGDFYKTAAVPLMARFSEREESVRLEILAAFETLLKQTSNARDAELVAGGRNKRKRSDDMDADAEDDSATAALLDMSPRLVKAILKQAAAKSLATRQQSFVLLRCVVDALHGGLDAEADAICTAAKNALRTSDSNTPSLTIAVLAFLTAFFTHHSARSYISHLAGLTQDIVRCMRDKLQRVSFEAFACASALACAIRPNTGAASPLRSGYDRPIQDIFNVTCKVLGDSSVDSEVREKALVTIGDILVHEGDVIVSQHAEALSLITARLASETTASIAIEVIGRVADAPLCSGPALDAWLLEILSEVVVSLRRNKRMVSKATEFNTINSILKRLGTSLPEDIASGIVVELKAFVESPAAVETLAIILEAQPASRDAVTKHILPEIVKVIRIATSPIVIKSLTGFFETYVTGDVDCAMRLVPSLVLNLPKVENIPDATLGGTAPYTTTARCIGAVVKHSQRNVAGILATFQRTITVCR
jgi:cullin-associated NEDD8-dissociated protein 1